MEEECGGLKVIIEPFGTDITRCILQGHMKWTSEFISDELQGHRIRSGGWRESAKNNNVINDVKFITDYLHKLHA